METVLHVDQLCRQPNAVAGGAYAPLQHRPHVQQAADFTDVLVAVTEGEGRGSRRHVQAVNLRQQVQDFLGQAVSKVGLVARGREIGEGQHGDGILWCREVAAGLGHRLLLLETIRVEAVEAGRQAQHREQCQAEQQYGLPAVQQAGGTGPVDAVRADVEEPGDDEHHRETENGQDHHDGRHPVGQQQGFDRRVHQLQQHEHRDGVRTDGA